MSQIDKVRIIPRRLISDERGWFLKAITGTEERNTKKRIVYALSATDRCQRKVRGSGGKSAMESSGIRYDLSTIDHLSGRGWRNPAGTGRLYCGHGMSGNPESKKPVSFHI